MNMNSYISKLLIERDQLENYLLIARIRCNIIRQDELDYEINQILHPEIIIWE